MPSNNQIVDGIERTPEYYSFMSKLEEFHKRRGTHLLKEPVHGGQSLDLLRIYKFVLEAGGYAEVTRQRLWKQVSVPFGFPDTTTNSAYVFKQTYIASLLAFEFEDYWKRPAPPPRDIEDQVTRRRRPQAQNRDAPTQSPQPESPFQVGRDSSPNLPPTTQPVTGNFMQPALQQSQSQSESQPTSQLPPQPQPQEQSPSQTQPQSVKLNGNASSYISNVPMYPFSGPLIAKPEPNYAEPGPHNRLLLSIKSHISEEVDWALHKLVKLSYEHVKSLRLNNIPGLIAALMEFITPVLTLEVIRQKQAKNDQGIIVREELFGPKTHFETRERMLAAALILRNASMLDDNSQYLASNPAVWKMVIEGLHIQSPSLAEFKIYCLDILDIISPYVDADEELWNSLCEIVCITNDKYAMITSLRTITRLSGQENKTYFLEGPTARKMVDVCSKLILLPDAQVVAQALDYLYQYTLIRSNAADLVKRSQALTRHMIGCLVHLLSFDAQVEEVFVPGATKTQASDFSQPEIPQEAVNQFLHIPEPKRAIEWMRFVFEPDKDESITQVQCWMMYKAQWESYVSKGIAMLPAADVIKSISSAFPDALAMVTQDEPKRFIIKGIKLRSFADPNKKFKCEWGHSQTNGLSTDAGSEGTEAPGNQVGCQEGFPSTQSLYLHVAMDHLPKSDLEFSCHWKTCKRFDGFNPSRSEVLRHVCVHLPSESLTRPKDSKGQPHFVRTRKIMTSVNSHGEPVGIPLTASLTLRNIAFGEQEVKQNALTEKKEEEEEMRAMGLDLKQDSDEDQEMDLVEVDEPSLLYGHMQTLIDVTAHNPSLTKYMLDILEVVKLDMEKASREHGVAIQTTVIL